MFPSYVDAILRHAAHDPLRPAIGTTSGVLSYGQLASAVATAATRLRSLGVGPGNIAAMVVNNPVWHITLVCALHRVGAISMTIGRNQSAILDEIDFLLFDEDVDNAGPGSPIQVTPDWFSGKFDPDRLPWHNFERDALCRIALSSGTTGTPKLIAMGPEIIWHRLSTYLLRGRFGLSERVLCGPQLRSHFAFAISFAALFSGKMVCFSDSASETLSISSYYGIDLAVISVHQLTELIETQGRLRGGLNSLREVQAGGAKISDQLFGKIRSAIPCPVLNSYASTEAGTVALGEIGLLRSLGPADSVGVLVPWANVDILNDDGAVRAVDSSGIIRVRAIGLAPEFETKTMRVVEPADFTPGDIGYVTSQRLLCIEGRSAELINVGGNKIAPETLERYVGEVSGVKEAAVFALDDNSDLPRICVCVTIDGDFDQGEIYTHMAKRTRVVTPSIVRIIPEMPRNDTGKIIYNALRESILQDRPATGRHQTAHS